MWAADPKTTLLINKDLAKIRPQVRTVVVQPESEAVKKFSLSAFVSGFIEKIPGGGIFLTVLAIDIACIIFAAGVLFDGAVAGAAMAVSLACLWIGAPSRFKCFILRNSEMFGWWLDVIMTVGLMFIGFSLGAVMGNITLFLGLNISAGCALVRYMGKKYRIKTGEESFILSARKVAFA